MAKVNFPQCATSHAWSNLGGCTTANEDCYYGNCYAAMGGADLVNWGYASSPQASCKGWGSQTTAAKCVNPRLDRDANGLSGICNKNETNPNASSIFKPFCGPENINLDNPGNGDEFAVGIRFYTKNSPAADNPMVHVNLYCDGARVFAGGYDPIAGNSYPQLITSGEDGNPDAGEGGDMWKVALVTTTLTDAGAGATGLGCDVVPTQSQVPDTTRDGPTTAYCVDDATLNTANSQIYLTAGGGVPANANALCYH